MCSKNNYLRAIRTRKPQVFLSDSSRTRHISHNNTKRKIQSSAHRSKDSERTLAGKETEGLSGARAGDLAGGGTTADTERAGNRAGNKSRAELESRQQKHLYVRKRRMKHRAGAQQVAHLSGDKTKPRSQTSA
jgi:hypothetical protein